eukprot:MONOS_11219.1-p1 / transcript=MONOS_11219.1 / gene=MONOS_11219 / organism=Monocercomonoides_exilis_PA203 / gene_product=unspecified product / transcript_product=unspecified product / location=Mono_scaffold00551:37732-40956(+) / protein_length=1074 / sequence_SO=supercontig / SO=protein_coding / is_pseudo=false
MSRCSCESNSGKGGGVYLESKERGVLSFVFEKVSFSANTAGVGNDIFVECYNISCQINETQFRFDLREESYARLNAIYGLDATEHTGSTNLIDFITIHQSDTIIVSGNGGVDERQCGTRSLPCQSIDYGLAHLTADFISQMFVDGESAIKGEVELDEMSLSSRSRDLCNVEVESRIECTRSSVISTSNTATITRVRFVFDVEFASSHVALVEPDSGLVEMVNCSFSSKHTEPAETRLQAQIPFHIIRIASGRCVLDGCCVADVALSVAAIHAASPIQFVVSSCVFCNLATSDPLIDVTGSGEISASHLELANVTISKRGLSLLSCSGVRRPMILNNCSIKNSAQDNSRGMLITLGNCSDSVIDSCLLDGNSSECDTKEAQRRLSNKVFNEAENEICRWNGSVVDFSKSSVMMKDTTVCNSSKGGMTVSGGNVMIEKGEFVNNNPSIANYISLKRNIICSDSGTLNVMSLKGGDGWERNTSLWMLNDGCSFEGIVSERASPFFLPVLESVEENEKGEEVEVVFKGKLLLPCNLSFMIVKQKGEEKQIEKYEFDESGYVLETEVEGRLAKEAISEVGDDAEVRVLILFGDGNNPSSTDSFILKNKSEPKANGDERIVEGGKEGKSSWAVIIAVIFVVLFLIVLVVSVVLAVRWRKVKNEAEDLREIVNDNIKKDPKAFEMVTMEMSPEEQWRRAEKEAEKKNEERIKKRIYDTNMQHSESSEHLLSESGSTEYILGKDSDKIPEWALEKVEEEEIRKRTPSPSISSTCSTDSDSTFVRGEDLCPTTSSMSNLVDAMACSSPHEKLIVDLRDSLFMLLHGRNKTKEMAIGTLQEREMTAAQILFWVANGALHSFDEMENKLQSLVNLSPYIVLFSEHMVICIVMHSDCSSDSDTSSSISSSTVVTSASDDESDSLPSSAFEDDEDIRKECLRWKAPELLNGTKKHATKKTVVFSIGMMLWECLTLQIPFGEYEAETAGEKIKNGERPGMESIRGSEMREAVENGLDGDPERRASLMQVKRYLVGRLPSGYTMATVSDAIAYCEGSEECGSEYIERSGVIVKLHSGSESEIQTRESSG